MAQGEFEGAKSGQAEAMAGLGPWYWVFNSKKRTVEVPGDGSAIVSVTEPRDVARFVLGALVLESWPQELAMQGVRMSLKEIVKIAEEVQGRKLLVREDSKEKTKQEMGEDEGKVYYNHIRLALWMAI